MTATPSSPSTTTDTSPRKIGRRERNAILQSLGAGVVPGMGLQHVQVGRRDEVAALVDDLKTIEQGGAAIRFIIGRFGSGKTFFLQLVRTVALERGFVTLGADITTDRRLHGSGGQARSLYSELLRNLATRAKPDGAALRNLVERWVGQIDHRVRGEGGDASAVKQAIDDALAPLQDYVSGYDFVRVIQAYYAAYHADQPETQEAALRWLRGEFATKTEARQALGVRSIIDDASVYDYLKLMAGFVRLAGYAGLLVNIDELVVLSHRLSHTNARNANYEAILRIVNDCLQGRAEGIGFVFAGTDECLEDQRRGLFSYEALATRLAPNRFAKDGLRNTASPVIRLDNLSAEDCFVLLSNLRNVQASYDPAKHLIDDAGIERYLQHCFERMGAEAFLTPRDTVRDFVNLLNTVEQNPSYAWDDLVDSLANQSDSPAAASGPAAPDDGLAEFRL
ncbi:MAG: ATP-binding protein [Planctomycetota bacterium]